MLAAGVAAVLALVVGVAVGRSIIPSPDPQTPKPSHFTDEAEGIELTYPAAWRRLASSDPDVRLLAAEGVERSLLVRVTPSRLDEPVTEKTLALVRPFTDDLVGADRRVTMLARPEAIALGGLVGYRYRYRYANARGGDGAHVHYFLFKGRKLIQLVFQAVPASALAAAEPTFERIAATFRSTAG